MTIIEEGRTGEDVKRLSTLFGLTPRTTCDKEMVKVMKEYQESRGLVGDGIFGYQSWKTLLIEKRYSDDPEGEVVDADYELFGWLLDCEKEMLMAFVMEESDGDGFLSSGRPSIRFESYQFFKNLEKEGLDPYRYIRENPDIITDKWEQNYCVGEKEWVRLEKASRINKRAAYHSTRWGLLQILGSDYKKAGENDVFRFSEKMSKDEFSQLALGIEYIKGSGLVQLMISKDFNGIAKVYNSSKKGMGLKLKAQYYRLKRKK